VKAVWFDGIVSDEVDRATDGEWSSNAIG
jgi:hypothetical protein